MGLAYIKESQYFCICPQSLEAAGKEKEQQMAQLTSQLQSQQSAMQVSSYSSHVFLLYHHYSHTSLCCHTQSNGVIL